ncbi:hypothetical protein [Streptomyces sp. NPDC096030]|uniref:hypothetical protein n=1 Tax=Streptomyces sp. NPDC096030 TaxID=3155423 RepID=UPI003316D9B9
MSRTRVLAPRFRWGTAAALVAVAVGAPAFPAAGPDPSPAFGAVRQASQDVAPFPASGRVLGAGPAGFLTQQSGQGAQYRWTRYADGDVTELPGYPYFGAAGADTVVKPGENGTYTLYDMGTGAEPVVVTTPGALLAVIDSTLVMWDAQTREMVLVSRAGAEVVRRVVTGLPPDDGTPSVLHASSMTLAVQTSTSAGGGPASLSLVDVATASVIESTVAANSVLGFEGASGSPTHLAWYEHTHEGDGGAFHLLDRSTGRTVTMDHVPWREPVTALSPGWLAIAGAASAGHPGLPLILRSLADGHEVRLLDRADEVTPGPGGTFLVRGGTLAQGEGLYRVSVGEDGTPAATLVASSGLRTELVATHEEVPAVVDFDRDGGRATMLWGFNRPEVSATLTLTHTATGKRRILSSHESSMAHPGRQFTWFGRDPSSRMAEYSGVYTWKMTARPENGVGPAVERAGTLTVVRPAEPRDHDANGDPDVLVRDSAGKLSAYDVEQLRAKMPTAELTPTLLGTGWNTYTLMAAPGDLGGSAAPDVVGRDRDGVLWLHQGDRQKPLGRTEVGGGWQVYNTILGGSDLDGDGRGDLLATDTSGVLWLYASTGNAARPFSPRKRIGGGWQTYDLVTATGNIAGAPGGDLVARDGSGTLWLYLGRGDGTFTARRAIGGGWQQFSHLVPLGNGAGTGTGLAELYAVGPSGSRIYRGTGDVLRPFGTPVALPLRSGSTTFKTFF